MRTFLKAAACTLALLIAMPFVGMAQDKKNKEEKKDKLVVTWPDGKMPELTQVKEIDDYLLRCDTMINTLDTLVNNMQWFEVKKIVIEGEDGNTVERYAVVDENDVVRSADVAITQFLNILLQCTYLSVEAPLLGAGATLYTTNLPKLGLKAVKYAKYTKVGYKLTAACGKGVVDIIKRTRQQAKIIKSFKDNFSETGELKNPEIDITNIDGTNFGDLPTIEKPSAEYEKEVLAAAEEGGTSGDIDMSLFDE